jgi:hypothetical protein
MRDRGFLRRIAQDERRARGYAIRKYGAADEVPKTPVSGRARP